MSSYYAVILAGGKGERFWPLSTSTRPKQLLDLVGDRALLGQAVERLKGLIPPSHIFIITNEELVGGCISACPEVPPANIIGEPVGRDTAAAVALGAALVKARDPQGAFCILTADHVIGDLPLYQATLLRSLDLVMQRDVLVTIGIKPAFPSTGYGYIEAGETVHEADGIHFAKAVRFVEKPDLPRAESYLASGRYFWNSGMFIWSVRGLEAAFTKHRPVLAELIQTMAGVAGKPAFHATLAREYGALEKISIDYALMEKADNIVMARGVFAWDDVGSWPALENHFPKDAEQNVVVGNLRQHAASGNIVYSKNQLTALVGVQDLIVVQADGVTLVCAKDRAQDIKKLVEQLRKEGRFSDLL